MQMFTWPSDLPSLEAVSVSVITGEYTWVRADGSQHVLDVFFEKVPTWPKMLRPSAVKTNLSLSPLHPDFPVSQSSEGYCDLRSADAGTKLKIRLDISFMPFCVLHPSIYRTVSCPVELTGPPVLPYPP